MAAPTLAEQMVAKYEALLLANAGLQTVNVDGTNVSLTDLEAKYDHWKARLTKERGSRPLFIEAQFAGGT